jgi:hypothetical protein
MDESNENRFGKIGDSPERNHNILNSGNFATKLEKSGKKKRKRVWIPASSLRRVGINAAANLVD